MLNAEKYRNQILEILNTHNDFAITKAEKRIRACAGTNCSECLFNVKGISCTGAMIKWLLSNECKKSIKLSRLEYDILKYISDNTKYLYITRDDCNGLFLYGIEPTKGDGCWYGKYYAGMAAFSKLFQFVQWSDEKPTSIKEVLDNCEVAEDAEE